MNRNPSAREGPIATEEFSYARKTFVILLLCLLPCGGCGKEKSTDELIGDLKSSAEEKERVKAVRLLPEGQEDAAQVVPALIEALKGKNVGVRRSAAIKLGYFGEEAKEAIPALQAALHDPDARIRQAAGAALSRIDPSKFPPSSARRPGGK